MKLFNINSLKGRLTLSVVVALIGLLALGGRSELRPMPGRGHILTVVIPIELERSGS